MNCKMYVVTHKKAQIPHINNYIPILVGADIHPEIQEYELNDNRGTNISEKNPNYCELTGIYWIWKNAHSDAVGISHYRRYFTKNWLSDDPEYFLKTDEASNILKNKRVILPKVKYYPTSIVCAINRAPNMNDAREMYQAINSCYPQYISDYMWYLRQNEAHLYNMFVMKWDDFCKYCEWLFTILDYIEKKHDMDAETDSYRLRLYGFLSERLLSVWVHHNLSKKDIELWNVTNTEEKSIDRVKHMISNAKRRFLYCFNRLSSRNKALEEKLLKTITE